MNKLIFLMCGAVGLALGCVQPAAADQCPGYTPIINSCVITWTCLDGSESVPVSVERNGTACTTKSGTSGTCNGSRFNPLCVPKNPPIACQGPAPTGTCSVATCGTNGQWQSEITAGAACTIEGKRGLCTMEGKCVQNRLSCKPRNVRCSVLCGPVGDVTLHEYQTCMKHCSALPVCPAASASADHPRNKPAADETTQRSAPGMDSPTLPPPH